MTYWLQELQQKRWEYCNGLDMVKGDSRTSPTPGDFSKGLVARDAAGGSGPKDACPFCVSRALSGPAWRAVQKARRGDGPNGCAQTCVPAATAGVGPGQGPAAGTLRCLGAACFPRCPHAQLHVWAAWLGSAGACARGRVRPRLPGGP